MQNMPFDNDKYMKLQKEEIYERIKKYGKLYIEVGGKLFDDNHAARVLPGFDPNVKMKNFKQLSNDLEVLFCINARDIITRKTRGDNGLCYDEEVVRLIYCMRKEDISVCGVVVTFFEENPLITKFLNRCKDINVKTYKSYFIDNYPNDIDKILSDDGFGKNDYVETHKNLILVSAPGASSGKLETCLSQLYFDKKNGISSGYSKYETFPVWNLPLDHLVNIAYEMATTDICDKNEIDPYFKKAYNKIAINYNRDIEAFPILRDILERIYGKVVYNSPTDMGINNVAFAINNDYEIQKAAFAEIERRHKKNIEGHENHQVSDKSLNRSNELIEKATEILKKLNLKYQDE